MGNCDHYQGYYPDEPEKDRAVNSKTKAAQYRLKRELFKNAISTLTPKEAIKLNNKEYEEYYAILGKKYPKRLKAFNKNEAFNDDEYLIIFKKEELLLCSYLYFLRKLDDIQKNALNSGKFDKQMDIASKEHEILDKLKKAKIRKVPEQKDLSANAIGLLLKILIDAGYISEATNETYGHILSFMTNISADNIRKAMGDDKQSDLKDYYYGKQSKHHLNQLQSALKDILNKIDELILEEK